MASSWEILGTRGWRLDAREDNPRVAIDDAGGCWIVLGESRIQLTKEQATAISTKFADLLELRSPVESEALERYRLARAEQEELKLRRMRQETGDIASLLERIKALK